MTKAIMQQMLQDVIDQFSPNPKELRSINKKGTCLYHPPTNKPKSIGCAIGMYIPWEDAKILDQSLDNKSGIVNAIESDVIPVWMKELSIDFLSDIQKLHDCDKYWKDKGLSEEGISIIQYLCNNYGLGFRKLKFKYNKV